jgi:hypothetical protein
MPTNAEAPQTKVGLDANAVSLAGGNRPPVGQLDRRPLRPAALRPSQARPGQTLFAGTAATSMAGDHRATETLFPEMLNEALGATVLEV